MRGFGKQRNLVKRNRVRVKCLASANVQSNIKLSSGLLTYYIVLEIVLILHKLGKL